MEANPANCENADAQTAVSVAKPTSLSQPFSDSCTFSNRSELLLLPLAEQIGEYRTFRGRRGSISADDDRSHNPFNALDSFLLEMETETEASNMEVPQEYRKSIFSLSDKSMVPKSVQLRKPPDPQSVTLPNDPSGNHSDINALDMNASQITIRRLASTGNLSAQHEYRGSSGSVYSSSIYSEQSAESEVKDENRAGFSIPGNQSRNPNAQEISKDDIPEQHTILLEDHTSNAEHNLLATRPLRPSRSTSDVLIRDSRTLQTKTFPLEHSPSSSKAPSPSSIHQSSFSKSILKEGRSETGSEVFNLESSESNLESKRVAPHAVNEKAARLLGLGQGQDGPKSPSPATPTAPQFPASRRDSNERSWSSPRIIRKMVSKISLTAQKTSPTSVLSPTTSSISRQDIESPTSHLETLSMRKSRSVVDGKMVGDARGTGLQEIVEETSNSSADDITSKLLLASKSSSISGRRGFRPLSVKIGEAFSPFSSRQSRVDHVDQGKQIVSLAQEYSQDSWQGLELSEKVNWTENLDPHIFNANFVATLTSKPAADIKDHPAFRVDPFSVQASETTLQVSTSSQLASVSQALSESKPVISSQTSLHRNGQNVETVLIGLDLADHQSRRSQTSVSPETFNAANVTQSPGSNGPRHNSLSSPPLSKSEQALGANRRVLTTNSPTNGIRGLRHHGHLPPSPSFARFNSRSISEKIPKMPSLFGSGSFFEEAGEGKRTRGFSNLFKPKSTTKNPGRGNEAMVNEESKRKSSAEQDRLEQIQKLRVRLNAHSYDHDLSDIHPRHPTTGRGWYSRNLRCTSCSDVMCSCCGRACCSFRACILAAENKASSTDARKAARDDVAAIVWCFAVGRESPTFIQCTHQTGCGKYVCPDCCGICPDECCQDVQCRKCKTHPWAKCDWHPDSDARLKVAKSQMSTLQQTAH
ncbi:hypothetical protein GJ744_010782 [Endocarpon pusillum]|uniref:Uncharacterized protein n=1 Tax=Endocarpon pusillum TaxID=364733 RepID=A0A8H7AFP4_9EURO|nr:hypothetical protein GJ744_010782 [Endocarpon pusillum]